MSFVPLHNMCLSRVPLICKRFVFLFAGLLKLFPLPFPHPCLVSGFSSLYFQNYRICTCLPTPIPHSTVLYVEFLQQSIWRVSQTGIPEVSFTLFFFPLPTDSLCEAQMKSWNETCLSCKNSSSPGPHSCCVIPFLHQGL